MGVRWLGAGLGAAAVLASAGAVVATMAAHWSFAQALYAFVVSNLVIGLSFALCGALIAWHRPRLFLGWLYAVGGFCQVVSGPPRRSPRSSTRRCAALGRAPGPDRFNWAWPVHIGLAIPLSFSCCRTAGWPRGAGGRSPAVALTSPLFVLEVGMGPEPPPAMPPGTWACRGTTTSAGSGP